MAGINDYSNTAGSNTTINGIDIAEGCSPAGINNAIRQLMADIADVDDGVVPLQTPDINGGTIDGAIIGGTTPAAGTFTNLTATGTLTGLLGNVVEDVTPQLGGDLDLNSNDITGTGNINITGTATFSGDLTVDTDTLYVDSANNRVGVGTTSPDTLLHISQSGGAILRLENPDGIVSDNEIIGKIEFEHQDSGGAGVSAFINAFANGINGAGNISFGTGAPGGNASEVMRITSQGLLGIGTSSPDKLLHLAAGQGATLRFESTTTGATTGDIFGAIEFETQDSSSAGVKAKIDAYSEGGVGNASLRFFTGDTVSLDEAMRIDSSGRVGIGTSSPGSFNAQARNLVVGTGSGANGITIYSGNTSTADIFFADGTTGDDPTRGGINYNHSNNSMNFRVNDSPKMYILSSGNVGIGTSSPSADLHIHTSASSASSEILLTNGDTGSTSTDGFKIALNTGAGGEIWNYENDYIRFGTNNSERMRIDSSGNVGVGESSIESKFHVKDNLASTGVGTSSNPIVIIQNERLNTGTSSAVLRFDTNEVAGSQQHPRASIGAELEGNSSSVDGRLLFATTDVSGNMTERMRINSSGSVIIGTTSTPDGSSGGIGFISESNSRRTLITASTTTSDTTLVVFRNPNGTVGGINTSGSSTAFNTSSDYRLKENVVDITGATERLKQLSPKRFNFIADTDTTVDGFLAHEVSDIVPEAITGTKDEVDADGNPVYQGIDQSKLVPLLVATIKELEARITALET